jgi:hypothetical protein
MKVDVSVAGPNGTRTHLGGPPGSDSAQSGEGKSGEGKSGKGKGGGKGQRKAAS